MKMSGDPYFTRASVAPNVEALSFSDQTQPREAAPRRGLFNFLIVTALAWGLMIGTPLLMWLGFLSLIGAW